MEASVVPKVTADLPTIPVSPVTQRKHLSGLELADPDYGTPARVDILLGGDVFSKADLHGRRYSPAGAPSAFKTCFGWVLSGDVNGETRQPQSHICGIALANSKGAYQGPPGKEVRWRRKSKKREVLASGMMAPEYTGPMIGQ